MVTKTDLRMLAGAVVTEPSINGYRLTMKMSDGTVRVLDIPIAATPPSALDQIGYVPVNKAGDTMTGRLLLPDGNAGAPSLGFGNDPVQDTGFFHPEDGVICVTLQGVSMFTFRDGSVFAAGNSTVAGAMVVGNGINCTGDINTNAAIHANGGISSNGNITADGDILGLSDESVKTNIVVIPDALKKIMQLNGVTYDRTDKPEGSPRESGFIAQNVFKVLPEVVRVNGNGKMVLAYGNMVGLVVEGVKELNAKVSSLEEQIKKLTEQFESLKGE